MAHGESATAAALESPVTKISAWCNQLLPAQRLEQQKFDKAVRKPALSGCTPVGPVVMCPQWDRCRKLCWKDAEAPAAQRGDKIPLLWSEFRGS